VAKRLGTHIHTIRVWEYNQYSLEIRHMPKIIKFLGYVLWDTSALEEVKFKSRKT
jgi:hypothetical protein